MALNKVARIVIYIICAICGSIVFLSMNNNNLEKRRRTLNSIVANNNDNNNNNNNRISRLNLFSNMFGGNNNLGSAASSSVPNIGSKVVGTKTSKYNFKIYVYDLPLWANSLIHKRNPWCSNGVFSSEIYIHQQLINNAHGVRTFDPEEADFFFIPVYATCLVYRSFSQFPKYRFLVEEVLKHIINEFPYWKRTQGRDHIWPFVHDFGGCLSWLDNTDHIYFKELRNSIFLSHLGDLNMGCFNTHKDIVIPPLMVDPRLWRDGRGGQSLNVKNKTIFAHFRGTVNWYHEQGHYDLKIKSGFSPHYSNGVRQYLLKRFKGDALMKIYEGPSKNYLQEVRDSLFCLCPRGFAPWSRRFFDSVALGCIPVVIADNIELPFEEFIDYRKFTVKVMESDIVNLKEILMSIPQERILEMLAELRKNWIHFTYQQPYSMKGDAYDMILRKLARKVQLYKPTGGSDWVRR